MRSETYHVVEYTKDWVFVAVISGMGMTRGTWDSGGSKRTAQRWASILRKEFPSRNFKVERVGA